MRIHFNTYTADLSKPIDISIPLVFNTLGVNCFYAPLPEARPVRAGDFVGSTQEGGPVNFLNIVLNPHGNGTHTECVGHIAKEVFTINQCLREFHFLAQLITVYPEKAENGDRVITLSSLSDIQWQQNVKAVVIRTQPNDKSKQKRNYSGTNPPYIHHAAVQHLVDIGIEHLLIDLPSVDKEQDGGKLLAHKTFWQYPDNIRANSTITELIYVPDAVKDGVYLLHLQIAGFEIDVSPSKATLYEVRSEKSEVGRKK